MYRRAKKAGTDNEATVKLVTSGQQEQGGGGDFLGFSMKPSKSGISIKVDGPKTFKNVSFYKLIVESSTG